MFRQIQRIPFKSVAVRKPGIGKSELLLADISTMPTFKPLNLIIEKHSLQTDGNYPKSPGKLSPKDNVPAPADRTTNLSPFALDGKDDCPSFISGADIFIANQPKNVIQKTRGHTSPPIKRNRFQFLYGVVCPLFSSNKYASTG
jgi:hypothetical protein